LPRVVHFDIKADEPESLKTFYEEVFQWRFDKWDDPSGQIEYYLVKTGEDEPGIDGGLAKRMGPDDQMDVTIGVINIDQYIKKIEDNGGKITSPKMAIPGVGWILNFTDPQGNKYVLMEDDPNAH
jgi:hypothetical protein